jgi:hypothetical protein
MLIFNIIKRSKLIVIVGMLVIMGCVSSIKLQVKKETHFKIIESTCFNWKSGRVNDGKGSLYEVRLVLLDNNISFDSLFIIEGSCKLLVMKGSERIIVGNKLDTIKLTGKLKEGIFDSEIVRPKARISYRLAKTIFEYEIDSFTVKNNVNKP